MLLGVSSCMPPQGHDARVSQVVPPPSPRQLLRDLALDVPKDLAGDLPGLAGLPSSLRASIADDAAPAFVAAAPPFLARMQSDDDAARATECLTAAVYYEARSEPVDGQRAVAQVVLNRVRDRAFPHSVCGVVYQGSNRRTGCQFSFTCDGSMAHPREPYAWARARAVAEAALAGSVYAPVGAATFYHTDAILPWWASSLARIGSVGAHIFYRWRGAMEGALSFRAAYAGVEPGTAAFVAADAAPQTAAFYRDSSMDSGVTVHRGKMTPVASVDAPAVATTAKVVRAPRMVMAAGVRVHLGSEAPRPDVTDGATIGEESDPI
ncbi:MAG: cell wall hydrolase [Sphingomonas taxi]